MAGGPLKIDDLARLTGITVDTIRFYQREGLLPDAIRSGRSLTYLPDHVRALERIKDLQARHFSLRAIKSLADEGRLGLLEELFASDPGASGPPEPIPAGDPGAIDPSVVADLVGAGLLPAGSVQECDPEDLPAVRAAQSLLARGMPRKLVVLLVHLYVEKFAELERAILEAVAGRDRAIPIRDLERFATSRPDVLTTVVPLVNVIFQRVQTRTMHTLVQESVESLAREAAGRTESEGGSGGDSESESGAL